MQLERNPRGQWCWTDAEGQCHEGVHVASAFPISAPGQGVSVLDAEGHELAWFESLDRLPSPLQAAFTQALREREFLPEIQRLVSISSPITPSQWEVQTDRGTTRFMLKGEEDIRRLNARCLLVSDADGVQYLIRDLSALDRGSRKLLDRFM